MAGGRAPRLVTAFAGRLGLATAFLATVVVSFAAASAAGRGGGLAGAQGVPPPAPNTQLGELFPGEAVSLPFVLPTAHLDFMYSSGFGGPVNIELRTFTKLGHWSRIYNPLPQVPSWAVPGDAVWSPDVRRVGDHYVMWFSAVAASLPPGDTQTPPPRCLGSAVSASPFGPFVPHSAQPEICQWSHFGDIDPRTFVQHGQEYLLWKSDDNAGLTPPGNTYQPTRIWAQKLAPDGTTLLGSPVRLLQNTKHWEGFVVEAPDMVAEGGKLHLFFSSTYSFQNRQAAGIGVAECRTPLGPCQDESAGPWLGSNQLGHGPDEESLFQQHGVTWMLFSAQAIYYDDAVPELAVSRVAFQNGQPYLAAFDGARPDV